RAFSMVSVHARVPVGIVSDFEERMPFIADRVRRYSNGPLVIGLLGNTFGNLDLFEGSLLRQLEAWLVPGDQVLLDINLVTKRGTINPSTVQADKHSVHRQRLFANGWARQVDESPDPLLRDYKKRVTLLPGGSDVPGTVSFDFVDAKTGRKIQNL